MKRGDIVSVALPRDYGKPRPALVIQADIFSHLHSVTVLPLTSDILAADKCRVTVDPSPGNGLLERSQIMAEKISTVPRDKTGPVVGQLAESEMTKVTRALAIFFGLV